MGSVSNVEVTLLPAAATPGRAAGPGEGPPSPFTPEKQPLDRRRFRRTFRGKSPAPAPAAAATSWEPASSEGAAVEIRIEEPPDEEPAEEEEEDEPARTAPTASGSTWIGSSSSFDPGDYDDGGGGLFFGSSSSMGSCTDPGDRGSKEACRNATLLSSTASTFSASVHGVADAQPRQRDACRDAAAAMPDAKPNAGPPPRRRGASEDAAAACDTDDSQSVSSSASTAAYFEPSDLNPGYWGRVMGDHAPTLALGVVAVVAAVLHPILFVAGTLAALGTYTAATATTNINSENDTDAPDASSTLATGSLGLFDFLCSRKSNSTTLSDSQNSLDDAPLSSIFCWNTSGNEVDASENNGHSVAAATGYVAENRLPSKRDPPSAFLEPDADQCLEVEEDEPRKEKAAEEDQILSYFVAANYPPLDYPILKAEFLHGLSALEFFKIFLDDCAPYNFIEFQKKRGDTDIVYHPWEPLVPVQGSFQHQVDVSDNNHCNSRHRPVPLFSPFDSDSSGASPHVPPVLAYQQRIMTFRAKTNAIFGPSYAPTTKMQRFVLFSKRLAVLESKTELSNIPFSDRFCVVERWIVRASKSPQPSLLDTDEDSKENTKQRNADHRVQSSYGCKISASCQVIFLKPCGGALEGQIRAKAHSTLLEVATGWCCMAREALRLAEAAKLTRLGHCPSEEHGSSPLSKKRSLPPSGRASTPPAQRQPLDEPWELEAVEVEHSDNGGVTKRASVGSIWHRWK